MLLLATTLEMEHIVCRLKTTINGVDYEMV